ncbi:MAG: hypothetical protein CME62_02815 [Halobacteriovoraceae bacterium]|nr:hypothetical protein [Halobacteriovoraceae bacterium]
MENTDHTEFKIKSGSVRLKLDQKLSSYINDEQLHPAAVIDFHQPDIICIQNNLSITLEFTHSKVETLECREESFLYTLNKAIELLTHLNLGANHLNKNMSHQLDKYLPGHKFISQLNSNLKNSQHLNSFVYGLLETKPISHFQSIYYFIHRKASSRVKACVVNKNTTSKLEMNFDTFTHLFNSIKKSKNHSFGQETLKGSEFDILGTCIALNFSLKNDNLILIFSHDNFLPQTQQDIDFFTHHSDLIKSYFEIVLAVEYLQENVADYIKIFKNLGALKSKSVFQDQYINTDEANQIKQLINIQNIHDDISHQFLNIADIHQQDRMNLLGELLNTLKHELSNPLFGLQLTSDLLKDDENLSEDERMFLEQIHLNIIRSQKIISNFSGLYNKKEQLEKIDIENLINEIFTLTKSESRDIKKKIDIQRSSDRPLISSPTWIAQILFNLVINSTQALKEKNVHQPEIIVSIFEKSNKLIIAVQDNGPGIPKDIINDIFEPFCTTKDDGTGLGLSISSRLAQKLGGKLKCEASERGACFELELPL